MKNIKDHLNDKFISIDYFIKPEDPYTPTTGDFLDVTDDDFIIFIDEYGSKNFVNLDHIRFINEMGDKKGFGEDE